MAKAVGNYGSETSVFNFENKKTVCFEKFKQTADDTVRQGQDPDASLFPSQTRKAQAFPSAPGAPEGSADPP